MSLDGSTHHHLESVFAKKWTLNLIKYLDLITRKYRGIHSMTPYECNLQYPKPQKLYSFFSEYTAKKNGGSLVGELRSHRQCSVDKKKKKRIEKWKENGKHTQVK